MCCFMIPPPPSVVPEALKKHQSIDIIYAMQQHNLNLASEHIGMIS